MATRNIDPEVVRLRGGIREGRPDAEERRAALREATRAAHIRRLVEEWPPLSDETVSKLRVLFAPVEPSTSDGGDGS